MHEGQALLIDGRIHREHAWYSCCFFKHLLGKKEELANWRGGCARKHASDCKYVEAGPDIVYFQRLALKHNLPRARMFSCREVRPLLYNPPNMETASPTSF